MTLRFIISTIVLDWNYLANDYLSGNVSMFGQPIEIHLLALSPDLLSLSNRFWYSNYSPSQS